MADGGKVIIKIDGDSKGFKSAMGGIEKVAGTAFKGIAIGATATATAVGAIGVAAVKSYADYEQLIGGVETLFKDSAKTVENYANQAFKTAGMSANEYMSTVTSFSASLLQSLGGDTAKAAEYGNQAVIDMSDNANKMGTSIEMIQNAYQGFAKQNYTMLDNLKLGYGGTKTEMERLLKDAEKISGIKFNIDSFADVTRAIHVIQTKMGITGTTAKEAASTIQGSAAMMKASWQNLMTGIADPNKDFDKLVQDFVDSVVTFGKNLAPRIRIVLNGVVNLFRTLAPEIVAAIREMLPQALGAFGEVLSGVLGFVQNNIKPIIATIYTLTTAFMALKAVSIVSTIISGVSTAITTLGTTATIASKVMAGLNVVMAANPFGAIAAAIGLVIGGLVLLNATSKKTQTKAEKMYEQSKANVEQLNEEADAYRELKKAKEEEASASLSQIAHAQSLYNELTRLSDASGYVEEKDRSRVEFIINELNSALGTEISMIDGVIQKRGEIGASIDAIIEKKRSEILLSAHEETYKQAIINQTEAVDKQRDAYMRMIEAQAEAARLQKLAIEDGAGWRIYADEAQAAAEQLEVEYAVATHNVKNYSEDISDYEAAMAASIEGNHEKVREILDGSNTTFQNAADTVGKTTEQIKQQAGQNYADAVAGVQTALNNYNNCQSSANEQALNDAILHASDMRSQYTKVGGNIVDGEVEGYNGNKYKVDAMLDTAIAEVGAYSEQFKGKGGDAGQGYADGIASKIEAVKTAAANLVNKALTWIGITQKSNSPAKETIWKGEDFGDGYIIGINKKKSGAKQAGRELALASIEGLGKDAKTEVEKVLDSFNEDLLESEQKYLDESARIEKEKADKELAEKIKNAKNKAEVDKIYAEEAKKKQEKADKEYLDGLKETADKERKIYDALIKDREKAQENLRNTFNSIVEDILDDFDEIKSAQENFASKLKDYGDLYKTETIGSGSSEKTIYRLGDLASDNKKLEEYGKILAKIKERGVPKEFFDVLKELSVDEAMGFANALLKADDAKFNSYIEEWQKKQDISEGLSKTFFEDETQEAMTSAYNTISNFSDDIELAGQENADAWGKGFLEEVRKQIPQILSVINSAFGDIIGIPTYALASGTGTNGSIINEIKLPNVQGCIKLNDREVGKMIVEEGNKEKRRLGVE